MRGLTSSRSLTRALPVACLFASGLQASLASAAIVDRDEFSTTTTASGGRLETSFSAVPVNFQTNSGVWKPIDLSLRRGADGDSHARAVEGDIAIPASLSEPLELEHEGAAASMRLLGAEGAIAIDGNEAAFDQAVDGVNVTYVTRANGVKETLELKSPSSPRSFAYELRGRPTWSAGTNDGDVVLRDSEGVERYRISAPLAWDSRSGDLPSSTNALELAVARVSAGTWRVTLRPSATWLADPSRVYPVYVDPNFTWSNGTTSFSGASDCYLIASTSLPEFGDTSFCGNTPLRTGVKNDFSYKSLLKFDVTSAIPRNAVVSSAEFKAYAQQMATSSAATPPFPHVLRTVTSAWDHHTTWNSRQPNTPWATAGGDVSPSESLASPPTSVSPSGVPGWFSWNAPVATVQRWINGTIPNYGFQLASSVTGDHGQIAWTGTGSSNSTNWPKLNVTWTPDTTPPTEPTALELLPRDASTGTAGFVFTAGVDSGTGASGVDHNEYRVRRGGEANFSSWNVIDGSDGFIDGVSNGQGVELEVRTVDGAGNVSATVSGALVATTGSAIEGFDEAARSWLLDRYDMDGATAQGWIDAQARTIDLIEDVKAGVGPRKFAGHWFENETQKVHVKLTDPDQSTYVQGLAANHNLASYVVIDITSVTDARLDDASTLAQDQLQTAEEDGWVDIAYSSSQGKVTFEVPTDTPTSVRAQIDAVAAGLSVPTSITDDDETRGTPVLQKCGPQNPNTNTWDADEPGREIGCDAPFRGGVQITAADGEPCTAAFNVRSFVDDRPYVMTAGHCYDDTDIGKQQQMLGSSGNLSNIGPLHKRFHKTNYFALSRYEDAALIAVTDQAHGPRTTALRPWIYYQHVLNENDHHPQLTITGVGYSVEGKTLCMSGSISGSHCGTIKKTGKAHGTAGYIEMCTKKTKIKGRTRTGDSGGPFIAKTSDDTGLAAGLLSGLPNEKKPCLAQYSSFSADLQKMGVWLVTPSTVDRDGNVVVKCESPYFRGGVEGQCVKYDS